MTADEQFQFRTEFKSIVYKQSEILSSKEQLRKLHMYDKQGSHEKAILKELDNLTKLRQELKSMLKGKHYEDWKQLSKRLSILNSRLKNAITQKAKAESEIENLNMIY